MDQIQRSMCAYYRILKLAQPITDIVGEEKIATAHMSGDAWLQ
jgi:predicted ATPase with chaperone activity